MQGSKIAKGLPRLSLQYSEIEKVKNNGPSGAPGFPTSILTQNSKKIEGGKFLFSGKNYTVPKKLKGGTLWDFPTSILMQNSKKIEEGTIKGEKFSKKSLAVPKKLKGGPFSLARYCMLRGKTEKKLFGSVR